MLPVQKKTTFLTSTSLKHLLYIPNPGGTGQSDHPRFIPSIGRTAWMGHSECPLSIPIPDTLAVTVVSQSDRCIRNHLVPVTYRIRASLGYLSFTQDCQITT